MMGSSENRQDDFKKVQLPSPLLCIPVEHPYPFKDLFLLFILVDVYEHAGIYVQHT